jgi:hypothetical protein
VGPQGNDDETVRAMSLRQPPVDLSGTISIAHCMDIVDTQRADMVVETDAI